MPQVNEAVASQLMTDLMSDYGLSWQQAAGLVGNLAHESAGFNTLQEISPAVPGSRGGYGYAQWTGSRRDDFDNFIARTGLDPESYAANYLFMKQELDGDYRYIINGLRTKDDVASATRYVSNNYLRPGVPHMDSRQSYAKAVSGLPAPVPAERSGYIQAMQAGLPVPPADIPSVGSWLPPQPSSPPPAIRTNEPGRMPSEFELAAFRTGGASPPLDMQLARDGGVPSSIMPSLNSRSPDMPVFNAAYDPRIGAMVPIPPTQHLGSAVLGSPYPQGMEQDRGLQAALAAQIAPPPSPFAPSPVATVPINPATGMPQGSYNDTGSMPSFASLANFATGAPASSPSTSVAQMYGGMLPPAPVSAPRADNVGSMPSMADLGSFISPPSVVPASNTTYVRPDGSSSPAMTREAGTTLPADYRPSGIGSAADLQWAGAANAGVTLGPMVAGGLGMSSLNIPPPSSVPTPAPSSQTTTVANPAYAQYMAAAAKEAKAQEMARAQQSVLNSPYAAMMGKANATAQQMQKTSAPLPQPKPLSAPPPKTITITKPAAPAPRPVAAPKPLAVPMPRARPNTMPKPAFAQFQAAMAAPQGPNIPPPPPGAVGTAGGYYFGRDAQGRPTVNLGRVNPNLTPAQTYAAASNYNATPKGQEWAIGINPGSGADGGHSDAAGYIW